MTMGHYPTLLKTVITPKAKVLVRIEEVNYEWDPKIIQTSMERNMANAGKKIKSPCSQAVPLEIEGRVSKKSMYAHVHSSITQRTYTVTATEAVY